MEVTKIIYNNGQEWDAIVFEFDESAYKWVEGCIRFYKTLDEADFQRMKNNKRYFPYKGGKITFVSDNGKIFDFQPNFDGLNDVFDDSARRKLVLHPLLQAIVHGDIANSVFADKKYVIAVVPDEKKQFERFFNLSIERKRSKEGFADVSPLLVMSKFSGNFYRVRYIQDAIFTCQRGNVSFASEKTHKVYIKSRRENMALVYKLKDEYLATITRVRFVMNNKDYDWLRALADANNIDFAVEKFYF